MQFVKFCKKNEIKKFRSSTYLPTFGATDLNHEVQSRKSFKFIK